MDKEYKGICQICLRIDKKVHKTKSSDITTFYRELCKCSREMFFRDPIVQCCNQCEYLLIKMYNFKQKCLRATEVFESWRKGKIKGPLNLIYKKLPPNSLGLWIPDNSTVFCYQEEEIEATTIKIEEDLDIEICEDTLYDVQVIKDETPNFEVPLCNQVPDLNRNTSTLEATVTNKQSNKGINNTSIQATPSITQVWGSKNVRMHQITPSNPASEFRLTINHVPNQQVTKIKNVPTTEVLPNINMVKSALIPSLHVQNVAHSHTIVNTQWMGPAFDSTVNKNSLTHLTPNNPTPVRMTYLSGNADTPSLQVSESKNIPRTGVLPNINITQLESTSSLHVKKGRRRKKVGQCNVVNNTQQTGSALNSIVTETNPANNNNLRTNGPVLCLQDILASITSGINQTKNDLCNDDDDDDDTVNACKRYKKTSMEYSKENLKMLLMELFSSHDELINFKPHKDTIIDKDLILSLLDHKMSERQMRCLWNLVYGKKCIQSDTLQNLAMLQNSFSDDKYESVFDIVYLRTEEEVRQEFQNRKTYKCYTDAPFKCEICYEGFMYEKRLIYHQKCHTESAGRVVCDICNKRFANETRLKVHRPKHEIVYKCKLCPMVTIHRETMINHFNQHNGFDYKCPGCVATFRSRSACIAHCNNSCSAAPHFCNICGRRFVKESTLKYHMTVQHKNEPPVDPEHCVRCPQCKVGFNTRRAMYRHCLHLHGERVWYEYRTTRQRKPRRKKVVRFSSICPLCKEGCESIYWLKRHCSEKHPDLDFDSYKATLTQHLCHICGKAFRGKDRLKVHLDIHSGKRKPFQCPECPKVFAYNSELTSHMAYHRPPEQVCFVCGKMFKSEINLLTHMRAHNNDRRYKCHICGKAFIHAGSLTEHIKGVHKKIRRVKKKRVENKRDEKNLVGKNLLEKKLVEKNRVEVGPEVIEETVVYGGNESDENIWSEDVTGVHQQIRRVTEKRDESTPRVIEEAVAYSGNESDENAWSEDVAGVHQQIRRVKGTRESSPESVTIEFIYSGVESDENACSEESTQ